MVPRYLSRRAVCDRTSLHFTTIYRLMAKGEFPRPYQLTARRVGWSEGEVSEWMASRPPVGERRQLSDSPTEQGFTRASSGEPSHAQGTETHD